MKIAIIKKLVRSIEYGGYHIYIYPRRQTPKAIQFYLFDRNNKLTKETIWIPKSSIEKAKLGTAYYDLDWLIEDYENKVKLVKIGYRL